MSDLIHLIRQSCTTSPLPSLAQGFTSSRSVNTTSTTPLNLKLQVFIPFSISRLHSTASQAVHRAHGTGEYKWPEFISQHCIFFLTYFWQNSEWLNMAELHNERIWKPESPLGGITCPNTVTSKWSSINSVSEVLEPPRVAFPKFLNLWNHCSYSLFFLMVPNALAFKKNLISLQEAVQIPSLPRSSSGTGHHIHDTKYIVGLPLHTR